MFVAHVDVHSSNKAQLQRHTHVRIRGLREGACEQCVDCNAVGRLQDAVNSRASDTENFQGRELGQGGADDVEKGLSVGAYGEADDGGLEQL